jgi:hypothetical protein
VHYTTSCITQSVVPEDGQNNCPKHVELIAIINKELLLHPVGCLLYSLLPMMQGKRILNQRLNVCQILMKFGTRALHIMPLSMREFRKKSALGVNKMTVTHVL